jgi:hypothetical protein
MKTSHWFTAAQVEPLKKKTEEKKDDYELVSYGTVIIDDKYIDQLTA